jgi:hypothetical protein
MSTDDPYTMSFALCDDDGTVRSGAMRHGTDYPCTGHAHFAGEHIKCSSPAHYGNLPRTLQDMLNDPFVELPRDDEVCALLGESAGHRSGER